MRTCRCLFAGLALLCLCLGAEQRPGADSRWTYQPEDVWAFQPPHRYPVPTTGSDRSQVRTPVDAFLLQKLREKGLKPAPQADRVTLIRRATFDLIGLPPTLEEVDAFVNNQSPDAFRKVIERLLASPQYGERWGRHWLDVVRYADSDGYSNDHERPNAWRYRDYVIRSFNQDKPYDRFILEQVAGDEIDPSNPENLIATGFLRMGPWEHTSMSVAAVTRQAFLDDVTHNTAAVFLGLTLGCARCHDHKFDPIPTRDYYRMQAVFASTEFEQRPAEFLPTEKDAGFDKALARLQEKILQTEARLERLRQKLRQRPAYAVTGGEQPPREAAQPIVRSIGELTAADLERERAYRKRLEIYRRALDRYRPLTYSVSSGGRKERKPAPETFVLIGGALSSPGEKVAPGVLSAVHRYLGSPEPSIPGAVEGRRLALARWIASQSNPLTARVMVNRIWQYHFGRGLAANPNNLGKVGKRPTHPQLLDWLAPYFIEHGWSIKQMHRVMMLSAAYQRASQHPQAEQVAKVDPENHLLSYFSPRRMEAEAVRDSILAVSGELSPDTGGPGTFPEISADLAHQPILIMGTIAPAYQPSPAKRERNRRTIYTFQKRSLVDPVVEAFNGPNLNESCERREATTVPTQVFALFNSKFARDMALAFAARLEKMTSDRGAQIDHAFQRAFSRLPTEWERKRARAHLEKMTEHHRRVAPPEAPPRKPLVRSLIGEYTGKHFDLEEETDAVEYEENIQPRQVSPETRALADLALVLFNSNEFIYIF